MTEAIWGVLGTLLTVGGGWLVARTQGRSAERAATAAASGATVQAAADQWREIADDTRERFAEVEQRLAAVTRTVHEQEQHSAEQDTAIRSLQDRLSRWVTWGHDLTDRWEIHREQAQPPALPERPTH